MEGGECDGKFDLGWSGVEVEEDEEVEEQG